MLLATSMILKSIQEFYCNLCPMSLSLPLSLPILYLFLSLSLTILYLTLSPHPTPSTVIHSPAGIQGVCKGFISC